MLATARPSCFSHQQQRAASSSDNNISNYITAKIQASDEVSR